MPDPYAPAVAVYLSRLQVELLMVNLIMAEHLTREELKLLELLQDTRYDQSYTVERQKPFRYMGHDITIDKVCPMYLVTIDGVRYRTTCANVYSVIHVVRAFFMKRIVSLGRLIKL